MSEINIVEIQGQLVIDSRIIAEQLGVKHKTFIETIRNHKDTIEANFGCLAFETAKPLEGSPGGRPETFIWLTEVQSTFVMTLSRNSPKVINCKVGLVKAFADQKRRLENPVDRALFNDLANRIATLETQPKPALPRASVDPIPQAIAPLTERACINRLIRAYAHNQTSSQPKNEQELFQWMYLELKYRYHYDAYARVKKSGLKSKLDQIAADGQLINLLAVCNHFLTY